MWKRQRLECSEDRYINVDRNRILERVRERERAHKDRCKPDLSDQPESDFKDKPSKITVSFMRTNESVLLLALD